MDGCHEFYRWQVDNRQVFIIAAIVILVLRTLYFFLLLYLLRFENRTICINFICMYHFTFAFGIVLSFRPARTDILVSQLALIRHVKKAILVFFRYVVTNFGIGWE